MQRAQGPPGLLEPHQAAGRSDYSASSFANGTTRARRSRPSPAQWRACSQIQLKKAHPSAAGQILDVIPLPPHTSIEPLHRKRACRQSISTLAAPLLFLHPPRRTQSRPGTVDEPTRPHLPRFIPRLESCSAAPSFAISAFVHVRADHHGSRNQGGRLPRPRRRQRRPGLCPHGQRQVRHQGHCRRG